jgi:hypothetical protein
MLLDHVSRGCMCRDELRGDQGGEGQQELFKGEFKGACPIAKVFWLWTHHIQEDINALCLLYHAIDIGVHCLLIKRVYLRGVGNTAALMKLLSYLLNSFHCFLP